MGKALEFIVKLLGKGNTGGETDDHGCRGGAGYTYNDDIGACIRPLELKLEDQRKAARIAVDYLGRQSGLSIVKVEALETPGSYSVYTSTPTSFTMVGIDDWEARKSEPYKPQF